MKEDYYPLPIPFQDIINRKDIRKVDLRTSVSHKILLTLISFPGESRYDATFGCPIWDYDFEKIYSVSQWKDNICKFISDSLNKSEKRLNNISVTVDFPNLSVVQSRASIIRERLEVKVEGNLGKTNESFKFSRIVYFSPFSFD